MTERVVALVPELGAGPAAVERLHQLLCGVGDRSAVEVLEAVSSALATFASGSVQDDDLTMMAIRLKTG